MLNKFFFSRSIRSKLNYHNFIFFISYLVVEKLYFMLKIPWGAVLQITAFIKCRLFLVTQIHRGIFRDVTRHSVQRISTRSPVKRCDRNWRMCFQSSGKAFFRGVFPGGFFHRVFNKKKKNCSGNWGKCSKNWLSQNLSDSQINNNVNYTGTMKHMHNVEPHESKRQIQY